MDPGIPHVPITTLAGVASLTDCKAALPAEYSILKVLPELPLPTPSPQTISNKSLLFHPRVAEEAQNLLGQKNEVLVPQLVSSLEKTSADHIEVKDNYAGADSKLEHQQGMPDLLKAILQSNPQVFSGKAYQQRLLLQQRQYQHQQYLRQAFQQQVQSSQQTTQHFQQAVQSSPQLPAQTFQQPTQSSANISHQQTLISQQVQNSPQPNIQSTHQHIPNSQHTSISQGQISAQQTSQLPSIPQQIPQAPIQTPLVSLEVPKPVPLPDSRPSVIPTTQTPQATKEPSSLSNIPTSVIQLAESNKISEKQLEIVAPKVNHSHLPETKVSTLVPHTPARSSTSSNSVTPTPVTVTPVTVTPVTATPRTVTPVTVTPATVTPATATPVAITTVAVKPVTAPTVAVKPVTATTVTATTVAVTPVAVTPIAVTPVAVTPVAVTPVAVTPVAVTPVAVTPVTVAPVTVTPTAVTTATTTAPITPSGDNSTVTTTMSTTPLIQSAASIGSTHTTTTSELRQLRRPINRGQQQQNTAVIKEIVNQEKDSKSEEGKSPPTIPKVLEEEKIKENSHIKQPIIKLGRISEEDQALMQKSLKEFVQTKPQLAKELGIELNKKNVSYKEDSGSDAEERSTRKKTKRKYKETDDEFEPEEDHDPTDTFSALVGKRRKVTNKEEPEPEPFILSKPKLRRVEKKFVPVLQKLSSEELMESNTYVRFKKSIEHVLRSGEDIDFAEIAADDMIQDENLLSRSIMSELCTEAAKLKVLGAMEMVPTDKLTRLLNILELNIRGGDRISPITDEDNESIRQFWLETTMERVMGAADACLTCLYIMTSPNMSKRVYLEEIIDRVVLYIKYHLSNTIFPSYDTTYKLDNKKKDGRRKKNTPMSGKGINTLYTKVSELVNLLSELLNIQVLTDTSVLHASSMGISPFFVENVSELQLACLKLVTTIFTKYENHRRLLLDDILASIARLPSTKRSLRTYRLNSEEHIQMLTALVLQLIQCVVSLPEKPASKKEKDKHDKSQKVDDDILICNKFEKATSTAGTFLRVFLSKCGNKSEEIDYRPLFENFVQDLLSTVNKPEWPATELLLCLLGKMLVQNFSNKGTDMSLRVASLDYLGVVAARLRRDSVLSRCKLNSIDQMIKDIRQEEMKDKDETGSKKKKAEMNDDERTQFLQRILLDFLAVNSQNDESLKYARHFYIAWWYKDLVHEKTQIVNCDKKNSNHRTSKRNGKNSDSEEEEEEDEAPNPKDTEQENAEKFRIIEEKKKVLLSRVKPFQESMSSGNRVQVFQTYIDYNSAELIAQFLASKRYFSQSFDQYLKTILIVLKETSIAIRTKAMKCLTMIVEADPSVLGRHDMQMGVNQSILDQSTSVREAAVDLIGKFILRRPELIHKYYEILSPRILDTGVSVRKRVIKILKDICVECPQFPKIPEICVKMIRRINDEEGIRKLVMEVFQNMWFTPTKEDDSLLRKVMHITDVVASSKEIGLEWFEQLLVSLYKPKEDKDDSTKINTEPPKALLTACRQIVDCLIENILRLEESNAHSSASERLVACVTTLQSFAKIRPQLLIRHASTLQPYLGLKCHTDNDCKIITCVARMLELVVPLMEHPSDSFLAQLEEDAMKLILQYNRPIVSSCLSCLGSIINRVTHNFQLIRDCFKRFNIMLCEFKGSLETYNLNFQQTRNRVLLRRALFVVGLLLRHFDFTNPDVLGDLSPDTKDQVYINLMFFLQQDDVDIQSNTLKALGSICIRHHEFMLEPELKEFYHRQLILDDSALQMKENVLINIENYLIEEENRMIQQDLEWSKRSKTENLKEMNDVSSGMASTVIQQYLQEVMKCYLHQSLQVRKPALRVIQLVCNQGLVHPAQFIPSLICMSTDPEKSISHSADKTMAEIEKKYPGFVHSQASLGIELSHKLQKIIHNDEIVRGFEVKEKGEYPSALNGYLYSLLRNSRQQRRALILKIVKHFDEQARSSLSYMLYLADNLAYFPYQVQDEPLFLVHHLELMISNSGTNLLQSFREGLISDTQNKILDTENGEINNMVSALDEDDDEEALAARIPENASHLQVCLTAAQGCLLLLMLKQHIKDVYGLSDGKIQLYSPSEPVKVYEKAMSRRSNALFNPKTTLQKLKEGAPPEYLDENGRRDLIRQYLDFKQLMLQLDPDDAEEDENRVLNALGGNVNPVLNPPAAILTEADQVVLQNYKDHSPPKVPKMVISHRRFESETKRTPRSHRSSEKAKKVRHKKKRRKITSDSESDENDYSDPDFMV